MRTFIVGGLLPRRDGAMARWREKYKAKSLKLAMLDEAPFDKILSARIFAARAKEISRATFHATGGTNFSGELAHLDTVPLFSADAREG
jgi:hypothetical protein